MTQPLIPFDKLEWKHYVPSPIPPEILARIPALPWKVTEEVHKGHDGVDYPYGVLHIEKCVSYPTGLSVILRPKE